MKQLLSFGLGTVAIIASIGCGMQSAQAAQFFNFSYSYSNVTAGSLLEPVIAEGTLQTNDGNGDGSFTIEGILGQRNGIAITSLIAPGSAPGKNMVDRIDRNDNLLFPTKTIPLSFNGFSYNVASGDIRAFNVFASNNFPGTVREFNPTQGSQPPNGGFTLQVAAVPTPALLPGLIGMGIAAIRKKRSAKQA